MITVFFLWVFSWAIHIGGELFGGFSNTIVVMHWYGYFGWLVRCSPVIGGR